MRILGPTFPPVLIGQSNFMFCQEPVDAKAHTQHMKRQISSDWSSSVNKRSISQHTWQLWTSKADKTQPKKSRHSQSSAATKRLGCRRTEFNKQWNSWRFQHRDTPLLWYQRTSTRKLFSEYWRTNGYYRRVRWRLTLYLSIVCYLKVSA